MASPLGIRFWGTRGLISSPRLDTAKYGGNTICMQILHGEHLIIVDSGFGAANFGEELMQRIIANKENLKIHIFYTHFHWDHIQGLPFFHPIYFKNTELNLYSPMPPDHLEENLNILFDGSYSPFAGIRSMPSQIKFIQLAGPSKIGDLTTTFHLVDHGNRPEELLEHDVYAYRFEDSDHRSIVIATDHEARPSATNQSLVQFAQNCDILVHDSQFTEEEYALRMGWGHSSSRQALDNALRANAQNTLLMHHAPHRTDGELEQFLTMFRMEKRYKKLIFDYAVEGKDYFASAVKTGRKAG